ncbi:MAG: peptidylprolyl isomerase [Bryobacteraceae bacterium]
MRAFLIAAAAILAACSTPEKKAEQKPALPATAPDVFRVKFTTSKGDFTVEVNKAWAPFGADRFYELLRANYFDEARFYRVMPKFVAQFGIHRDPEVSKLWRQLKIVDDKQKEKNTKGTLAFAQDAPNSRTTQIFINLADNRTRLDGKGFVPFGKVVDGMEVCEQLYGGYGEIAPRGPGPDAAKAEAQGNEYIVPHYPKLDYIKKAVLLAP